MDSVTAFAPATVSNVACGFDVLGFALGLAGRRSDRAADRVRRHDRRHHRRRRAAAARRGSEHRWRRGAGAAATAPASGAASRSIIRKGLPLSSGLGGSAASAAAAVVAVDALFNLRSSIETLIACALEGERLGAGSAHADNIAPSICGGFVLVRRASPPDIVRLPVPAGLTAVVVHPDLEIETAMARRLLGDTVLLEGRHPAVGEPRRVRRQSASRRLRSDGAIARGPDRRAAPRAARARARGDQAGRRRRRRARLQPVRFGAVAVRAVPQRRGRRARGAAP